MVTGIITIQHKVDSAPVTPPTIAISNIIIFIFTLFSFEFALRHKKLLKNREHGAFDRQNHEYN